MKKRLLIVGAGGLGREIFGFMQGHETPDWTIGGFLDDTADPLAGFDMPVGVVGRIDDYTPRPDDVLLPAIGDAKAKLAVCRRLEARGAKFATFVHPTAVIGYRAKLGAGVFVFPGAVVAPFAVIGDYVSIGGNATVGHDARIGPGCTLCGHAEINGWTQLGEGVFMGSHATVIPKVKVADHCVLGAGSVTIMATKAGTTVFGVPSRRVSGE